MHVIGLTGGIGSGKTTVADLFAQYGVPIIDADRSARELVEPGQPALNQITQSFGPEILNGNGTLDRKKLRELIFNDPKQRKQLEDILHPLIRNNMLEQLDAVDSPYAILVIPLLVDTGNWDMIDRILVVDTEEDLQIDRVMQRDAISQEQTETIIDNQVSRQERLAAADDVIENTGSIDDLKTQVKRFHEFYLSLEQQEAYQASHPPKIHANSASNRHWYEQPLNERIRTFLRLEHLFERATYHSTSQAKHDAHAFIHALIEINNLVSRGDLKNELIKELERQSQALKKHAKAPAVDQGRLNTLLREQEKRMKELIQNKEPLGQHLKGDILFNNFRQRLSIPGGVGEFDLPIYSYWLNLPMTQRKSVMQAWLTPLQPLANAISLCLETIRGTAEAEPKIAINGYYEQTLNGGAKAQLIRVAVEQGQPCYPTISAGKQRFSIRFMEYLPGELSSPQVQQDVTFGLTICNI
ncbi:MAG TPA: cell division protein ZapD [Gammaproteobacteria bacterium]